MKKKATIRGLLNNAPLVIFLLLVTDSLHFVFARLFLPYIPATLAGLFTLGVATVEMGIYVQLNGGIRWQLLRHHLLFFLAIGSLVALSTSLTFASVAFLDAGTAAMLSKTNIVFALGLGYFWLRERLTPLMLGGALLAIIGVIIISFQPGDYLQWGALIVLGGAFSYALHTAIVKRYGESIPIVDFFLFRIGSTMLFLFIFAAALGELAWPPLAVWPILLLAGTVNIVLSRMLYYLALRRLQMSFHAIILTLSPVMTIAWSLLLFREQPSARGLWGGTVVIIGVFLVTWRRQQAQVDSGG